MLLAATAGGCGELFEKGMGLLPVDASVGDALAVDEGLAGYEFLRSGDEVALDHDADDSLISGGDLCSSFAAYYGLAAVILIAVGVAEVDHASRGLAGLFHF